MSSHQLAIAKASFTAALLRPDPTSVAKEDVEQFHLLLNAVILQCSPPNIQKCKRWILGSLAHSTARFTALGKYLTTLTNSFDQSSTRPSPRRKCLHILYLLNDILHHAKAYSNDASISSKVQPSLVALFSAAASFKNTPKHDRKIQDLLDIWEENSYYSPDYIAKLREAVKTSSEAEKVSVTLQDSEQGNGEPKTSSRAPPFVMPAMHGDPSTPWYDLPAANLMPHIVPNSTRPIRPDLVKPLQFVAGPADETLVNAVKDFLAAVDEIHGVSKDEVEETFWDVDELGQQMYLDATGEVNRVEGYYGWSKEFCEKMRKKRRGLGRSRSRSRSRSSSRSLSESGDDNPRSSKRRRRSSSGYSDSSRSRSRSPSRQKRYQPSRSTSMSRTRSRSPDGRFAATRSEMNSGLQSGLNTVPPAPQYQSAQPVYSQQPMQVTAAPYPPPHYVPPIAPPYGPNGMIPPPPPPVGYNGTWPGAPPPPQYVPSAMPYGQPIQTWPQAPPPFNGPPHWQPNVAPTGPSGWNGIQPQYQGDGRGGLQQQYYGDGRGGIQQQYYGGGRGNYAWNGAPPPQPYYNNQQPPNQGYGNGGYQRGGRGNFRGRGRG